MIHKSFQFGRALLCSLKLMCLLSRSRHSLYGLQSLNDSVIIYVIITCFIFEIKGLHEASQSVEQGLGLGQGRSARKPSLVSLPVALEHPLDSLGGPSGARGFWRLAFSFSCCFDSGQGRRGAPLGPCSQLRCHPGERLCVSTMLGWNAGLCWGSCTRARPRQPVVRLCLVAWTFRNAAFDHTGRATHALAQ